MILILDKRALHEAAVGLPIEFLSRDSFDRTITASWEQHALIVMQDAGACRVLKDRYGLDESAGRGLYTPAQIADMCQQVMERRMDEALGLRPPSEA